MKPILITLGVVTLLAGASLQAEDVASPWKTGSFHWKASQPLIDVGPGAKEEDPHIAIKDPTVVHHDGKWHIFATLRKQSGKVDIEYLNFTDWEQANQAERHILALHDKYYCAPQIFYFTPHEKWYLIYQLAEPSRTPPFGPCFSTTTNLADPKSWTAPLPMVTNAPAKPKWLDFWVICDEAKAHLFYTSLDGHMWRRETKLADFPYGWSEQTLAIEADVFEASHTYKLKGRDQYVTLIEAQAPGRRYYKAYLANQLEGPWTGLADNLELPFAARENVDQAPHWSDSFSHGELLRTGIDQHLEVDPNNLRLLFQGVDLEGYRGKRYGTIEWRLGLLDFVAE